MQSCICVKLHLTSKVIFTFDSWFLLILRSSPLASSFSIFDSFSCSDQHMEGNLLLIGSQLEARSGEKLVSCWNDDASGFLTICPATQQPLRHSEHFRIISRCNQRAIFCRKNDKFYILVEEFLARFQYAFRKVWICFAWQKFNNSRNRQLSRVFISV